MKCLRRKIAEWLSRASGWIDPLITAKWENTFRSTSPLATKKDLIEMEKRIMATEKEIIATLKSAADQLKKLDNDTQVLQGSVDTLKAKIVDLETIIANGAPISQELTDAVAEVKSLVQKVDDNVPEVPAPPTTPE